MPQARSCTTGSSAAAAAAAADAVAMEADDSQDEDIAAGDGARAHKRRKQQLPVAEKVRRLHGQVQKTPGAGASIRRFLADVETPQEQVLFWQLYNRFTSSGRTHW